MSAQTTCGRRCVRGDVLVEARGLTKDYPTVRALDGVSLDVREGEIFGLFGPNGAGKTTCIRVLTGLTVPSWGEATVCGLDVLRAGRDARQWVSVLFDIPVLYEKMRFREYLRFFGRMAGLTGGALDVRVWQVLTLLEQNSNADRRIGRLSMGERQRVEIGRVLMSDSRLLFLDEPFSNIDVDMRIKLRTALRAWLQNGGGVVFTSHNLLEAESIVDRFAFLAHGRVTAVGTAKDLKERLLVPVYQVEVSDAAKALEVLSTIPAQDLRLVGPTTVQITLLMRSDARQIARRLSEADVDVLEMKSMGTMEDVFRTATRSPWMPPGGAA